MERNATMMIDDPMVEALSRFLDVNVARHKLIASNLANIDTPGYRTRDLDFRAEMARMSGKQFEEESGAGDAGLSYASLSYASRYAGYAPVARTVRGLIERPDGNNV